MEWKQTGEIRKNCVMAKLYWLNHFGLPCLPLERHQHSHQWLRSSNLCSLSLSQLVNPLGKSKDQRERETLWESVWLVWSSLGWRKAVYVGLWPRISLIWLESYQQHDYLQCDCPSVNLQGFVKSTNRAYAVCYALLASNRCSHRSKCKWLWCSSCCCSIYFVLLPSATG